MELDAKQKVLLAIYTEYQKDLPDMEREISFKNLDLDNKIFRIAIDKLQNEQMINGATIIRGGNSHIPLHVNVGDIKMTRQGIDFVEQKLQIDRTLTGVEKVKVISQNATKWGWEQLKDLAAKVLSEMLK
ncbi:hypothetical protein Psch_02184 [Pelotomaculum schinkii]|uniref:YjcQ protein n=1 Tax=Pelotomaculum schinkii TaxID=78350 RepID=A0A4Y7RHY3_9FIRM|nr:MULTISPECIES: YjcQ family protein [Pelotomaculum]TEB08618.1 hypothetical protein Psch_02184 [Pelotomaculum schinkii]TEB16813.1 hypothetical protein Psfp_00975 [Pelotomaculum sp. FP]